MIRVDDDSTALAGTETKTTCVVDNRFSKILYFESKFNTICSLLYFILLCFML